MRNSPNKLPKKVETQESRSKFARLFRDEKQLTRSMKRLFVIVFAIIELMILAEHFNDFGVREKWKTLTALFSLLFSLTTLELVQLFVLKNERGKTALYYVELAVSVLLLFFTYGTYALMMYMLVLTAFYVGQSKRYSALRAFGVGVPVYVVGYGFN
ncbi:MAG: hypothetical protein IJ317_04750, partial [Clostridia bacterium]|nr:hypothetical protein [Clostridia bacterium]